jgi:hypothetical protein
MIDLRPCPSCRRHVGADEVACPFCAGPLGAAAPAGRRMVSGRLTRAAIFAGAVAASGCGSSEPKTNGVEGGGDQVLEQQQPADAGEVMLSAPADAAVVPVETDPRDELEEQRRRRAVDPNDIPMPYGAPPARSRLV